MKKIKPEEIVRNPIAALSNDWMLISSGDKHKFNTMTASWGGFGFLWNKPVAYIVVRPQRYTFQFIEENEGFTLSFFDNEQKGALKILGSKSGRDCDKIAEAGLTPVFTDSGKPTFEQARTVLECRKLYCQMLTKDGFCIPELYNAVYQSEDALHKLFIGEITDVWIR